MKSYLLNQVTIDDVFAQVYLCSKPGSASNNKLKKKMIDFARATDGVYTSNGKDYLKDGWIDENKWSLRLKLWRSLPATMPREFRRGKTVYFRIDEAFKRVAPLSLNPVEEQMCFVEFAKPLWKNQEILEDNKQLIVQKTASGFSIFYLEQEFLRPIKQAFLENKPQPSPKRKAALKGKPKAKTKKKKPRKRAAKKFALDDMSDEAFLHFIGEDE